VDTASSLDLAPASIAGARRMFLKREDLHELGSFKWRGALPALERYRALGADAVITASTGNHGAATAWAARRLGMRATVFAPLDASREKLGRIEGYSGEIRQVGRDLDEAKDAARRDASARRIPFFEDGAEPAQYGGYGMIAHEILDSLEDEPGTVVVPTGNGALIAGIGLVLRKRAPSVRLVAAVAKAAPVMAISYSAGHAVPCVDMATFADGLAVRVAIPSAVDLMLQVVSEVRLVSEREIAGAMSLYAADGIRAEGAAGAGLAAALQPPALPDPVVVIVTGRNIDEGLYRRAIEEPGSFPP
jgi:threonine dehydratase